MPAAAKRATHRVRETSAFADAYARLNGAQKLAVDTIEGPVMVVAGPGTGKTQVLALRAANILRRTHAKPGNILCLTYANSGVKAMRERLRSLVGTDAYGIAINTMHGFCNDIVVQHPHVFAHFSAMRQIGDLERVRILNTIIDQKLPHIILVNRKSPYAITRKIIAKIALLKREGMADPGDLERIARENRTILEGKSREGTKAHAKNLESARKFEEFVSVFCAYQEALRAGQFYDYEDMILFALSALREEEWMLASLQERYQYILVDEFQDLNGAQEAVLALLTTDPTGDNQPNFFAVGDDDQAIYRFQGASLAPMLHFRERFPRASVIALTTSYRCSREILSAAGSLISRNEERLALRIPGFIKELRAEKGAAGIAPKCVFVGNDAAQSGVIGDLIEERIARAIAPEEIAVLAFTNAEIEPLAAALRARGISVEASAKADLFRQDAVRQAVAILRAALAPVDDARLAGGIGCPCFGCHPADLGHLYVRRMKEKTCLLDVLLRAETFGELRNPAALVAARDTILRLHQEMPSRTVTGTLARLMLDSGLLAGDGADPSASAALSALFAYAQERALEQPGFGGEGLLADIAYYEDPDGSGLSVRYDAPRTADRGVQIMTAHRSKGLEFRTVILLNFRSGHWDGRQDKSPVAIPEHLLFGWDTDESKARRSEDERRLAFVAMTRAKEEILFFCPEETASGARMRDASPSAFLAECGVMEEERRSPRQPVSLPEIAIAAAPASDDALAVFLRSRVEEFRLSPTALNDFLDDPLLFRDRHLLRTPEEKAPVVAYGNAMHHALAVWGQRVLAGEGTDAEALFSVADGHLQMQEVLTPAQRGNFCAEARDVLARYFAERLQPPHPCVAYIEKALSAHIGDIPVKGKIDRIDLVEPAGRRAIVTDYKAGRPKTPREIEEYGYRRQIVFYALLIEESGALLLDPEEFRLEFLGDRANGPKTVAFAVTEAEKRELRALIGRVWEKIVALDFSPMEETAA